MLNSGERQCHRSMENREQSEVLHFECPRFSLWALNEESDSFKAITMFEKRLLFHLLNKNFTHFLSLLAQ